LLFSFFLVASVQAQDEPAKMLSLNEAKTVQDVLDWFKQETEATQTAENRLQVRGRNFEQAGKRITELGEADASANAKVMGLISLIMAHRAGGAWSIKDYDQLRLFLDELEESGTYHPGMLRNHRYFMLTSTAFFMPPNLPRDEVLASFDFAMENAKQFINFPLPSAGSTQPIQILLTLADSQAVRTADPEIACRAIKHLMEFAKSDKMTINPEAKKEVIDLLTKHQLFTVGSDPKLYGKTLDNEDFDWKSLRGKYVLIKFTATWCGPCKLEIPGMREAYEKYRDKGFEIVSIYIAERGDDPVAAVRREVEYFKQPWIILSEALTEQAGQPRHSDFYASRSLPKMVLVDKEGKIIMANARGDRLKAKLAEIFE